MSMKAVWLIDGLCSVIFLFIIVFIFVLPSQQQELLGPLAIFSITPLEEIYGQSRDTLE